MITDDELREILQDACKKAGSQRKWALDNKLSPSYVNDVLQGKRDITEKIAKLLGYARATKIWVTKHK